MFRTKISLSFLMFLTSLAILSTARIPRVLAAGNDTVDYLAEYEAISYDSYDGLVSAEINAITQTPDGYIWVGTYSGLYRYDGSRFEKIDLDERICNVMALFVDSKGRLWIGTNDTGLACYDLKTKEITFYTPKEGLSAYSIRSICEDKAGNLFVGTVSFLSMIKPDGSVSTMNKLDDIIGIRSLSYISDGVIGGVTNSGLLFFIKDNVLLEKTECTQDGVYYTSISRNGGSDFLVGTSTSTVLQMSWDGSKSQITRTIDTGNVEYYNEILYDDVIDSYFFCAESGMGLLSKESGQITYLMKPGFDTSISGVIKDYQGNVWFVSNKQGIIEYSKNPFMDVFVKAQLPEEVTNAIALHDGAMYFATDDGVKIVDRASYIPITNEVIDRLSGVRTRHIMEDSHGNLWISTYGQDGLLKVAPGTNEMTVFNESSKGTLGGRFRYCLELKDGTVVAASNMGLNYIRDDTVIATIGEKSGMDAPQILTMIECPDGSILAGSDGDGIYRIKDTKIISHIGIDEGLDTLVVLRIVPCRDGYLYVTSNALYYDDTKTIRRLNAFPYSNNYDVYITDEDEAWISSSAGIYIVRVEDLLRDDEYNYTILDYTRGFTTSLTANAWNAVQPESKDLLLCCTNGVRQIATNAYDGDEVDFNIAINTISYDDTPVPCDAKGRYVIPSGNGRIQINPAILNYSLSNPLIRMYLDGASDDGLTMYQENIVGLNYTNLPYGSYTLHIQILDPITNAVLRDETYSIYKNPHFTELKSVRILIFLFSMLAVAFFVWQLIHATIIRRQYVQIREAKDEAERANSAKSRFLANMSHEIRTPINTIMGMDEMIMRTNRFAAIDKYANEVTGYARSIHRAAEALLGLVNDILDLSKIESGKMNLVEQNYEIEELLRAVLVMIRVRADEKGLDFTINIDPTLPLQMYGDDGKIKQVVLNLLTNAVKYTPEGSFGLTVEVKERDDEHCKICFTVSDTGIGIRPEDMDKLFSAFERLDEQRNSGIQGTGLGLDISRQFVELMGGKLECKSTYGKGSEFYFTITQKIVDGDALGEFKEDEPKTVADGPYVPLFAAPEGRVLVVDDNDMNLMVIKGLLAATGVSIDTATSGMECLDMVDANAYHVVLLDHMMPKMDGIETCHQLKKKHPDLPVVALTANAATSGEEYYISEGFEGFLAKPVDGRKLEETLAAFIPDDLKQDVNAYISQTAQADSSDDPNDAIISALSEIDEMSITEGIQYCGNKAAFVQAVQTFSATLDEKYAEIENAFLQNDLEFYTIKVHALKSTARIIGIAELSALAEKMELAGKSNDIEALKAGTPELLAYYRLIDQKLHAILDADTNEADKEEVDLDTVSDALNAIHKVASLMDYDSVEMILDSMKSYRLSDTDKEKFKSIEYALKKLDWNAIADISGE